MAGSRKRTATIPHRNPKKSGTRIALFGLAGLVGLFALPLALHAQPAPWQYPYYDGYPPPLPPGQIAARETGSRAYGAEDGGALVPLAEIRRRIALMGFHLIAAPRHKDHIYLAEAEDAHGLRHRIVFDAYEGNIIENTKLGPKIKKISAKSTPEATSTAAVSPEKKAQASEKPLPSKPASPPIPDPPKDPD